MKPLVGVVTYNTFYDYKPDVYLINDIPTLILPETFTPKPNVSIDDPHLNILWSHRKNLKTIIVFVGKKKSGALNIIRLMWNLFGEKVLFISCQHDHKEKVEKFKELGIPEKNVRYVQDLHFHPCRDHRFLRAAMNGITREMFAQRNEGFIQKLKKFLERIFR